MFQKGFSKIWILIIVVVIAGGVLALQYLKTPSEESPVPQLFSCEKNEECVLTYTGMESCAPCDYSDESYQCVSPEEAEKLQQERLKKHGHVLCDMCPPSPLLFRCVCKEGTCEKTSACEQDEDCHSKTTGDFYKCIANKCQPETLTPSPETNLYLYENNRWKNICPIEQFNDPQGKGNARLYNDYLEKFSDKELDLTHNGYKELVLQHFMGGATTGYCIAILGWDAKEQECRVLQGKCDHGSVMHFGTYDLGDYDKNYDGLEFVTEDFFGAYNQETQTTNFDYTFKVYHWDITTKSFELSDDLSVEKIIQNSDVEKERRLK